MPPVDDHVISLPAAAKKVDFTVGLSGPWDFLLVFVVIHIGSCIFSGFFL